MPYYKFGPNDLLYNQVKAHPRTEFITYISGTRYYNSVPKISGTHVANVGHIPTGHVSLYEMNVDRRSGGLIYPFLTKESGLSAFNTVSLDEFNQNFNYGDEISSSYPLSSSYHRRYYAVDEKRVRLDSIKTAMKSYTPLSPNYRISSSFGDYSTGSLNLISIPSIFYGSEIKKGTVDLKFFITGTLVGRAQDINRNGNLIQTLPVGSPGSGSTVGVALYGEGVLLLNGLTDLSAGEYTDLYEGTQVDGPRWTYFGTPTSNRNVFSMAFEGTTYTPTMTMFAKAPQGELNHSNNPTFRSKDQITSSLSTGKLGYFESPTPIKNINSSSFSDYNESFNNVTYISSIGVYDKDRNLIAVAKLANPVRKLESEDFTFKLKLDI
tara:strand:- start:8533 stop:9672 length:1140 start_codon:yes stop_codon:yes gene_type:complete